jgi:hypothetical protein
MNCLFYLFQWAEVNFDLRWHFAGQTFEAQAGEAVGYHTSFYFHCRGFTNESNRHIDGYLFRLFYLLEINVEQLLGNLISLNFTDEHASRFFPVNLKINQSGSSRVRYYLP